MSARRLLTRILLHAPYHCHSAPTNKVCDHHRYQPHDTKLQGWVHYKKNQYQFQITTISKKHKQTWWAYTTFIIQHSHPTIIHHPHSTITHHPFVDSIKTAQNDACTWLTLRCNVVCTNNCWIEWPKRVHTALSLRDLCWVCRDHLVVHGTAPLP